MALQYSSMKFAKPSQDEAFFSPAILHYQLKGLAVAPTSESQSTVCINKAYLGESEGKDFFIKGNTLQKKREDERKSHDNMYVGEKTSDILWRTSLFTSWKRTMRLRPSLERKSLKSSKLKKLFVPCILWHTVLGLQRHLRMSSKLIIWLPEKWSVRKPKHKYF